MNTRATPSRAAAAFVIVFLACSGAEAGPRVLLVRPKQASVQFDEATAAFGAELNEPMGEQVIDDDIDATTLRAQIEAQDPAVVVAVGARAASLVAGLDRPVVACMLLQASAAATATNVVKVPVAVPARAQLEALRGLVPSIKSVGVLYDPRFNEIEVAEARAAAAAMKLTLVARTVTHPKDTPAALDALLPEIDALLLPADASVVSKAFLQYLVKRAFDRKLPVLTYSESFVRIGLLAALVPSYADNGRLAARITRWILEGAVPQDLQAAAVMKGSLVVNASSAKQMGLSLPPRMLAAPTTVVGK